MFTVLRDARGWRTFFASGPVAGLPATVLTPMDGLAVVLDFVGDATAAALACAGAAGAASSGAASACLLDASS